MKTSSIAAAVLLVFAAAAGCGRTTTPTPAPQAGGAPAPTRIINVTGDLTFGNVVIGTRASRTFTVGNSGTATLTISGITGFSGTLVAGLSASPLTGTIAPGESLVMTLFFAPTVAQTYSTVVTVQADQTAGAGSLNFSGTGVTSAPAAPSARH